MGSDPLSSDCPETSAPARKYLGRIVVAVVVAAVMALSYWQAWGFVLFILIPVGIIPASVVIERWVGRTPRNCEGRHPRWSVRGQGVLCLCALLPSAAAFVSALGYSASTPKELPLWSPLPLFVMLPEFVDVPGWVIAALTFVVLNRYLARVLKPSPIPSRFPILLAVMSALSIFWFAGTWIGPQLSEFHPYFVGSVRIINVLWILSLWGLWLYLRRGATRRQAFALAILLHCWLFWYAFPFCWLE
ncbi:MAG: hypothetical protein ABIP48_29210 [Planctomycetota bacterium]